MQPNWNFDDETAIATVAPDRYESMLSSAWNIGPNPNGGYVSIPGLRAMADTLDRPDPLSLTTHYLRPGVSGQTAAIETEHVRDGRRTATAAARLIQDGKERLRMLGVFGDLSVMAQRGELDLGIPPPTLPRPEDCLSRTELDQGVDLSITSRIELRVDPRWVERGAAGEAEVSGWARFVDERPVDTMALALLADAFPPSVFSLYGRIGWVPTVELTVHFRRRPVEGWIQGRFRTLDLAGELLVEDGELWDESGALVARCRQLAVAKMD